jgi:DNA-binding NtrC family response regulator
MQTLTAMTLTEVARKNLSICVLDDNAEHVEQAANHLEETGFAAFGTTDPQEALRRIRLGECRVILVDYKMPSMDGMAFLEKTLQFDPGMHVILVTGFYSVDSAIEAIKRGAVDYLCKPLDYTRLEKTLDDIAALHSQRS